METLGIARLILGVILMIYSSNCWLKQKYWSRKHFDWRSKEHWSSVFWMNLIGSALGGAVILFMELIGFES